MYIPPKRDKFGKMFGFVKFKDVRNTKILEEELRKIWIGSFRLRVNLQKYQRNDQGTKAPFMQRQKAFGHKSYELKPGWSFAAIVKSNPTNNQNDSRQNVNYRRGGVQAECVNEWKGITFNIANEDMEWLQRSYVGQTHKLQAAVSNYIGKVFLTSQLPFWVGT